MKKISNEDINEFIKIQKILHKHFGDDKILYYSPTDGLANGQFIKYSFYNGDVNRVVISIGNDDGEVDVNLFTNDIKLDQFITLILFA
jgi:hypothetical protein